MKIEPPFGSDKLDGIMTIIGVIGLIISFSMLCINVCAIRDSIEKIEQALEQNHSICIESKK